jgi:hypothetical protein
VKETETMSQERQAWKGPAASRRRLMTSTCAFLLAASLPRTAAAAAGALDDRIVILDGWICRLSDIDP